MLAPAAAVAPGSLLVWLTAAESDEVVLESFVSEHRASEGRPPPLLLLLLLEVASSQIEHF